MKRKNCFSLFLFCFFSLITFSVALNALVEAPVTQPIILQRIENKRILSLTSQQEGDLYKRFAVKCGLYGAGIMGAIYLLHLTMNNNIDATAGKVFTEFRESLKEFTAKNEPTNNTPIVLPEKTSFLGWLKTVPGDVALWVKLTVPAVIAGKILELGWNKASSTFTEKVQEESLRWFYDRKTNLADLFMVIKMNAISLDLYSSYIDSDDEEKDIFAPDQEDDAGVVQQELARKNIQFFVSEMKNDFERLLAFSLARCNKLTIQHPGVALLIDLTNGYIDKIERLLNLSDLELLHESKEQRGLFTETVKFIKSFNRSFQSLHMYMHYQLSKSLL